MEIWKKINFENLNFSNDYEISSLGNIRNFKTKRILKINNKKDGYSNITLNGKTFVVHRLVAIAFIDNPNNNGVGYRTTYIIYYNDNDENPLKLGDLHLLN